MPMFERGDLDLHYFEHGDPKGRPVVLLHGLLLSSPLMERLAAGLGDRRVILLDLSRLISRAGRETPTGIDRVELAYAEYLIGKGGFLQFAMMTPLGRLGLVPGAIVEDYLHELAGAWRDASTSTAMDKATCKVTAASTAQFWSTRWNPIAIGSASSDARL